MHPALTLAPPRRRTFLGLGGLIATLLAAPRATAQAEAERPPPNVLLLVDTSGSMEFKTDGTFPNCSPGDTVTSEKSRWIDLIEVMTGTFDNYSCWAQSRSSDDFLDEFTLGTTPPYDFGYINPYHRALTGDCVYGPGVPPDQSSPYEWPNRAVNSFLFDGARVVRPTGAAALALHSGCPGIIPQDTDGLLDIYKSQVRFGLMTFDARVDAGTGLAGTSADYPSGVEGNWSYYGSAPITGHPANCSADMIQEVGARNAAAPPWEGRMIGFGAPALTDAELEERNEWIQQVLLTTRPYGATPLAGQLDDARQFLWNDTSIDPLHASGTVEFGPSNDPNWRASNCRKTIMVVLSDGEPNLDLRPFCEAEPPPPETAGRCPYEKPEDIVSALRLSPPDPNLSVETYVIGFALGAVTPAGATTPISCSELTDAHCADPLNNVDGEEESRRIQACCTLNEIAAAGGVDESNQPRRAYFAENRAELRAIFTDIFDDVVQVATRTMPVFSGSGGDSQSKGFKFFSAFDPQPDPAAPQLWEGILERRRFVCSTDLVPEEQFDPLRGDDFAANVNSNKDDRRFYTVIAGTGSDNRYTLRAGTFSDGIGDTTMTQVFASAPSALAGLIPPEAMQLTTCSEAGTPDACRDLIIQHAVGLTNAAGRSRCVGTTCRVFGGIYHSTPTVVPGRPSDLLRDESYANFGATMAGDARPSALYMSTVDGFLHAFNLAPFPGSVGAADREVDDTTNNELWAFIPPAVLPVLSDQYPDSHALLLDGVPIIKDVVSAPNPTTPTYERTRDEAQNGNGNWRTVLLSGFGDGQVPGGYFAVDITTPDITTADGNAGGPTFLWQLTRSANSSTLGQALFGRGGTPLITTVFLNAASGGPREVAVAVLPGGDALHESGSSSPGTVMPTEPTDFQSTRPVRSYPGQEAARSLTIVRLDNGEVIRTFRPAAGPFASGVVTITDIPAPITGQPKAFPETTGSVADRIFVGDRDGRLWRVDVSSQDASAWSMEVFFDAFAGDPSLDQDDGQPVILPPVLSVNDDGAVTVAFATGDQEATAAPPGLVNRVVSLTEKLDEDNDRFVHVNWIQELEDGDRVTGPMVLFNRGLYYAASRPPDTTTSTCDIGASKVYGTHFEESVASLADPEATAADPTSGPAPAPGRSDPIVASRNDGLIFGVSLEAEPTCEQEEEVIDGNDSFGYGQVSMSTKVNPGRFFLTFEVSGSREDSRGVLEVKQELQSPRVPVTFESFSLIYE